MEPTVYHCPGETQAISRAIHLARLATHFEACAECQHRHDRSNVSSRRGRWLEQALSRYQAASYFDDEGICADYLNQFNAAHARQLGKALGRLVRTSPSTTNLWTLIATDGGALTPEIAVPLIEGLRWAGVTAVELGVASAPELTWNQQMTGADSAVYIAQALVPRHRVIVRMWHTQGRPLSRPGGLDRLCTLLDSNDRPTRHSADRRRLPASTGYLSDLQGYFHALRPLKFLARCGNVPQSQQLATLLRNVGCSLLHLGQTDDVGEKVRKSGAHFAISLDNQGESLTLWDEAGRPVGPAALEAILRAGQDPALLGEPNPAYPALPATKSSNREAVFDAMQACQARLCVAPDHRFWFRSGNGVHADGLRALALLLVALSRSDRPLSQALCHLV